MAVSEGPRVGATRVRAPSCKSGPKKLALAAEESQVACDEGVGWTQSLRMDTEWTAGAMCEYGSCAAAGMLPLPHGSHLHLSHVPACSTGAPLIPDSLLNGVRAQHHRG